MNDAGSTPRFAAQGGAVGEGIEGGSCSRSNLVGALIPVVVPVALLVLGCADGQVAGDVTDPAPQLPSNEAGLNAAGTEPDSALATSLDLKADIGRIEEVRPVGPPPGHPLAEVSRDAGVSAQLRDGSVVWFFGDTAMVKEDRSLAFFEIGSAAWASADDPTVTLDHVVDGAAAPFAVPTDEFPTCPPEAEAAGVWPLATVVDRTGERDRVLLWMQNICLGARATAIDRGISLGEWYYDPARSPAGKPVSVEVINQVLFAPGERLGDAVLPDGEDGAFVYGCKPPESPDQSPDAGPCTVARVDLADAANPDAYEVWNGEQWSVGAEPAAVEFADAPDGVGLPTGPFSVTEDPVSGAVVLVYSPWPSYVSLLWLRVAPGPTGPFGPPVEVALPDCGGPGDPTGSSCYAANVQPFLTEAGRLGVGWHDQQLRAGSPKGRFKVATVPFSLNGP